MNSLIQKYIKDHKVDGFLITDKANVRYLTGFTGSNGQIFITDKKGEFLTDGRYITQASEEVSKDFSCRFYRKMYKEIAEIVSNKGKTKRLLFEPGALTVKGLNQYKELTKGITWVPLKEEGAALRIKKNRNEINILKKAAKIAHTALEKVLSEIKPGDVEKDIALALEIGMRKGGADGVSFEPIVASGTRSALPHGRASDKKIKSGELLTIDYGSVYKGYCSDETVTVVVGKADKKQKQIYAIVKDAHDMAVDAIKPGVTCVQIDKIGRDHISKKGYGKNFTHSTGHGVGLEVHELPTIASENKQKLEPGMVITVEPGIYLPGWGGVRIEDMILVTDSGHEVLTPTDKAFRSIG